MEIPTPKAKVTCPESKKPPTLIRDDGSILDWDSFLKVFENLQYVPPVTLFKHAPFADIWEDFAITNVSIEIPNVFVPLCKAGMIYWIGRINHFKGYKACVEYERFGLDCRYLAWISYFTPVPKPIGWSTNSGKTLLLPDAEVRKKYPDFLDKMLTMLKDVGEELKTIPNNHGQFCFEQITATRNLRLPNGELRMINLGAILEVLDRGNLGTMRLAKVQAIAGDRFHAEYLDDDDKEKVGFWYSINCDWVHLPGWSQMVEHPIKNIVFKSPKLGELKEYHFPNAPEGIILEKGRWLEVRHPIMTYTFAAASIHKVLQFGYIMLKIQSVDDVREIYICYHVTSPLIYPCGWAQANQLKILPPLESNLVAVDSYSEFSWTRFLEKRNYQALLFGKMPTQPTLEFKVGHKLEAIDLTQPSYLGPATILKVVEHMLFIHFDKWPMTNVNCQWVEASSPDIYPIGWAEMVGYNFESSPSYPVENDLEEARKANLINRL